MSQAPPSPSSTSRPRRVIVTGGAGFIGCNAVARLMAEDWRVLVIDNLSRRGAEQNLAWLQNLGDFDFEKTDITRAADTAEAIRSYGPVAAVIHLAGQVAVTTSLTDPRADFAANALGTFNVLEAVRATGRKPVILFSSTNKVYGGLEWVRLVEEETRWACESHPKGVDELAPLDFHSPYGCSKGAADQYVHDYGRCYGLPTIVLRQSCIMGPRQFGVEDQGWVAWFLIAAMMGRAVTVYGDGKQVRDLLWVEDLVDLYVRLISNGEALGTSVFNVGGGSDRTLSLRELLTMIERLSGRPLEHSFSEPRTGDQRWFVADVRRLEQATGWCPRKRVHEAVASLWEWLLANRSTIETTIGRLPTAGAAR